MAEISKQQVLDLLYEVADDLADMRVKMDELVVLSRIIHYEMELGRQQVAEARASYMRSKEALSP